MAPPHLDILMMMVVSRTAVRMSGDRIEKTESALRQLIVISPSPTK